MIYVVLISLLAVLSFVDIYLHSKELKIILLFCLAIVFALFSGIRYDIGTDFFQYKYIFEKCDDLSCFKLFPVEPGYILLNYVFNLLSGGNFLFFQVCINLIVYLCLFSFLRNTNRYLVLSFLIFISFYQLAYSFGAIRQLLGLSIMLYSYTLYRKKKKIPIFFVICSVLIHASMLIHIIIFILSSYINANRIKKYRMLFVFSYLLICFVIIFRLDFGFQLLVSFFLEKLNISKYTLFLSNANSESAEYGLGIASLLKLFLTFIIILRYSPSNRFDTIMYLSLFFSVFIRLFGNSFSILMRLEQNLLIFQVLLFPRIIMKIDYKPFYYVKPIVDILFILFFIICYISTLQNYSSLFFPYKYYSIL